MKIVTEHDGKVIERFEQYEQGVTIFFTDGSKVEIDSQTTEIGWITVDGESVSSD